MHFEARWGFEMRFFLVLVALIIADFDHRWSYSRMRVDTSALQSSEALRVGEYASLNLIYAMKPSVLIGSEVLWGRRWNQSGARGNDLRTQVSVRYHFPGVP